MLVFIKQFYKMIDNEKQLKEAFINNARKQ